jgi:hypothetical protein
MESQGPLSGEAAVVLGEMVPEPSKLSLLCPGFNLEISFTTLAVICPAHSLTISIQALQAAVQRIHGYVSEMENKVVALEKKK